MAAAGVQWKKKPTCTSLKKREKERKHVKGKTTLGADWCALDRRRYHRASVIYSWTGWHLCDSQSQSIRCYLPPPCHPFIFNSFLPRVEMPQSWMGTNIQTMLQGLMNTTKVDLKVGQDTAKGGGLAPLAVDATYSWVIQHSQSCTASPSNWT